MIYKLTYRLGYGFTVVALHLHLPQLYGLDAAVANQALRVAA